MWPSARPLLKPTLCLHNPNEEEIRLVPDVKQSSPSYVGGTGVFFNNREVATPNVLGIDPSREITSSDQKLGETNSIDAIPAEIQDDLEDEEMQVADYIRPEDDIASLTRGLEKWKPFVDRVANFLEQQRYPFEYVDVWVAETAQQESSAQDNQAGNTVLRHVGHATNSNTEIASIFTMYHMNQFGFCSEKYSFPAGVGLPGRVLARREPVWDGSLLCARFSDFPRSELARKHGVKNGLGIPLYIDHQPVIVSLYSTQDIREDNSLVQIACQAFQQIQPARSPTNVRAIEDATPTVSEKKYDGILPDDLEAELARLLRDHGDPASTAPLQVLLWRAPCRRSLEQNLRIDALKLRYKSFACEQVKSRLAAMVASAWQQI